MESERRTSRLNLDRVMRPHRICPVGRSSDLSCKYRIYCHFSTSEVKLNVVQIHKSVSDSEYRSLSNAIFLPLLAPKGCHIVFLIVLDEMPLSNWDLVHLGSDGCH
jgi:hypothetical protein